MTLPLLCTDCHDHAKCIDGKCVCEEGYDGNGNVCEGIYKICSLQFYFAIGPIKEQFDGCMFFI